MLLIHTTTKDERCKDWAGTLEPIYDYIGIVMKTKQISYKCFYDNTLKNTVWNVNVARIQFESRSVKQDGKCYSK